MKKIQFVIKMFATINTCVMFAVALYTNVFFETETVESSILWEILLVSFLCAASTLIYPWDVKVKKYQMGILFLMHYLIINAIVLGSGCFFDWYDVRNMKNVVFMLIVIAVIFLVVSAIGFGWGAREAKRINERLREREQSPGNITKS